MFHPQADQVAAAASSLSFKTYKSASSIYNEAYQHLTQSQAKEINTHVILSHILTLCGFDPSSPVPRHLLPSSPTSVTSGTLLSPSPPPFEPESIWIAGWSGPPHNRSLRLIVSLTEGQTGRHPLFVAALEPDTWDLPSIRAAMARVATLVLEEVPEAPQRVYAVFGPRLWAQELTTAWCNQADVMLTDEPNMAVNYMVCTILNAPPTPIPGHRIRRAGSDDVDHAAQLCKDNVSAPYSLSLEEARQQARTFISYNALFFYEVDIESGNPRVAAMLGVGRSSLNVASITKICTLPEFRKMGYGSRLLYYVGSLLLNEGQKSAVVAFIPFGDNAYERLATQVGFQQTSSGYREWLEWRFDGVDPGHW